MKEKKIDAGNAKLYITSNENLHTFCINTYFLAGSMYECKEDNGITHMFEHMVFRNLKNQYDEDIYNLMSENGIFLDGCTYKEFVYFSIYGIKEGFDLALDILSRLFNPINIGKEEFNAEKGRIKAEIRENDEKNTADHFHNTFLWKGTSLAMPITGTSSGIEKITVKDLEKFREKVISKGNIFFYATGNITSEEENKIKETVETIGISGDAVNRRILASVPADFGKRTQEFHVKKGDSNVVALSFDIDNSSCSYQVMELLFSILFVNEDAAVFQALSERTGNIYSYDSSLEEYENISAIKLIFEVDEKETVNALSTLIDEIRLIIEGQFNLKTNIQKQITNCTMMLDSPSDINWAIAYENHILKSFKADFTKGDFGLYDGISKEEIKDAAGKIFTLDNLVIVFKGNRRKIRFDEIKEVLKKLK